MKKRNIDEILNLVKRPSRYINNELNAHPADMSADFSVCLCFPDVYEVGASNLGIEILYHLINEKKLARCERCFAPDIDLESILRDRKLNLFSLESNSELASFNIVGFTIQAELVAANIINMLDLSGIAHLAKDRDENAPLIIAGGPALTNPEPFCDFFDLFVLGDGEEAIEDIINFCKKAKKLGLKRKELLRELSKIDGVYVPSLYNVEYNEDNTVKAVKPIFDDVKAVVKKRLLNLENAYFPQKKIVPFVETVHNRLNIEVARGCPGLCRFCQASKYYRPWRQRPIEKLLELVKQGIAATGYEEIAFSSLSCSDYKNLDKLLIETNNLYSDTQLNISLPSLRCNERSLKIAQYINRSKRPTLTFAPEAGTDRLRNVIGKYLSQKQIVETLFLAHKMGWDVIKLYFMIGLPTETKEDIDGISKLLKTVKREAKGLNFTATISPFVPKAQTAFQWEPMIESAKIKETIDYLNEILNANVKAHNHRSSVLEAFIAKGDRRVGKAIYLAWQKGARFDQWADKFGNDIWNDAIAESGLDLNFYVYRKRTENEVFAWDHINFGVDKETLYKDYCKGINEKADIDMEQFNQSDCTLPQDYVEPVISVLPPVMRLRFRFAKRGILKYISHLEQIEVFRRAARRTDLPIAFTAGFSPQVKAGYGPPSPVGKESLSEYMELYFNQKVEIEDVRTKMTAVLPSGFEILDIKRVPLSFPSIDALVNLVEYKASNIDVEQKDVDEFLSQDKIIIQKEKKGKVSEIDIKPLIKSIQIDNSDLVLVLRYGQGQTIKPELILKKLFESKKNHIGMYSLQRSSFYIEITNGQVFVP